MNTVVLKGSLVASLCCAFEADAQTAATPPELPPVMVTATRIESLAADAPASITGIDGGSWFAALNWAPPTGLRGGVEARYVTGVFVNDANSDVAPRYAVAAASVGYVLPLGNRELNGFVRGDNKFGRRYAGSAIVNEGNARYFEPAPGRMAGQPVGDDEVLRGAGLFRARNRSRQSSTAPANANYLGAKS